MIDADLFWEMPERDTSWSAPIFGHVISPHRSGL